MTPELLAGFAGLIVDAGLGVYNPSGQIAADETAISVIAVPQAPDNLIVLSPYRVQDALLNDSIMGLQVRCRGDENPMTVLARDDAIFNLIEGMHDTTVGGVAVSLVWRVGGTPGPQDENQRHQTSSNYYVRIADPTLYRVD